MLILNRKRKAFECVLGSTEVVVEVLDGGET